MSRETELQLIQEKEVVEEELSKAKLSGPMKDLEGKRWPWHKGLQSFRKLTVGFNLQLELKCSATSRIV